MPTVPLPENPDLDQLKKQAKLLLRAVREGHPKALALVAEQHRDADLAAFTLAAAQFVLARSYGFASWPKLRQHVEGLEPGPGPAPEGLRVLTPANRYHLRTGWADADDLRRVAAACPELADAPPLSTVHYNGVRVLVLGTPDGPRFCELTPTGIAISGAVKGESTARATLVFHTALGTLAGMVAPEVRSLSLERPADLLARERVVLHDGVFVVPNAFPVTDAGLVFRFDGSRTGEIIAATAFPDRAVRRVDRPAPAAERASVGAQRLAAAIATADAPPVVDPDQWTPGVHRELTGSECLQLGRYGNLLGWHWIGAEEDSGLYVFDFGPQQGPVRSFALVGASISATRMYYDFQDGSSGTVAVLGLVNDPRVASIALRRNGNPDAEASVEGGTFVIAGASASGDRGAVLVARDGDGRVLEELPWRLTS
ncbi:MAG TPA: hypothetical protein VG756_04070 [Pseudonocardiaceae bacterium]|nr:hypothetical protein [Pseudonocardiaceae bacterium]